MQLCAKFCPLLLPLKLQFSNCSMFSVLDLSINCCRSQSGQSQAMEQWRRSNVVMGSQPASANRIHPELFVPSQVK